jgi:hypothetical protein
VFVLLFFSFFRTSFRPIKGGRLIRLVYRGMHTGQTSFPLKIGFCLYIWSEEEFSSNQFIRTYFQVKKKLNRQNFQVKLMFLKHHIHLKCNFTIFNPNKKHIAIVISVHKIVWTRWLG